MFISNVFISVITSTIIIIIIIIIIMINITMIITIIAYVAPSGARRRGGRVGLGVVGGRVQGVGLLLLIIAVNVY